MSSALRQAGFEPDPVIERYRRDVDISLIIETLKLTPEQRIDQLEAAARGRDVLRDAARRSER